MKPVTGVLRSSLSGAALRPVAALLALGMPCLLAGCESIGPKTIPKDRFDYSSALGESWKRQTLLNIVKLRYMDLPMFLDVGQIVSGYTLETTLSAGGQLTSSGSLQGDSLSMGGSSRFTDRPTITYVPKTGDNYLRSLLEPLRPSVLLHLIQSGYDASSLMQLSVQNFNGLRNRTQGINHRAADPEFMRAVELMRQLQLSGSIGLDLSQEPAKAGTTVVVFRKLGIEEETAALSAELKQLLGLPDGVSRFELINSPVAGSPAQIALHTRSPLQILLTLSSYVEIPEQDVIDGRAAPVPPSAAGSQPLLRIRSGEEEPADSYFSVQYRNRWFWIDDTDWRSKAVFSFVMFIFTLGDGGEEVVAPMITIPAQ